jgi:uncharacterized protein (DUF427 family)
MSLTAGSGPFSKEPDGRFNFEPEPPGSAIYWHRLPYRVRGLVEGEAVVDSRRVHLLHETGHLPIYYFPREDVRDDLLRPSDTHTRCPFKGEASYWSVAVGDRLIDDAMWSYLEPLAAVSFIAGSVAFYWNRIDEWFVEDEQVFGHARDPFHRVDTYATTRRVRIAVDGVAVAETTRAVALFETGLPARWYIPLDDVRAELFEPSETKTRCAYKGSASYWNVRVGDTVHDDLAWTYREPQRDAEAVRDLVCFFNERVDLELDGELEERPVTQWSRAAPK